MKFIKPITGENCAEPQSVFYNLKDINYTIYVGNPGDEIKIKEVVLKLYKNAKFISYSRSVRDIFDEDGIKEKAAQIENFLIKIGNIYLLCAGDNPLLAFNFKHIKEALKIEKALNENLVKESKNQSGINILVANGPYLSLKNLKLKVPKIDMYKHYNDDFKPFAEKTIEALNSDGSGLVLLHGQPGTGKTTFIRFLTEIVNKRFIFLPPSFGDIISSPGFLPFLMRYPDSIIVMEDAENVVKERDANGNHEQVANVLNLTDGMVGDFLKSKIIFTFNCHISKIDKAITRKGRCLSMYEFEELEINKAKALAKEVGVQLPKTNKKSIPLSDIFG